MIGRWRERWADKENARRRRSYDAWGIDDAELRSMRRTAASFAGEPVAEYPGEPIYLTVSGASHVAASQVAALPPVGVPFSPPTAPVGRAPAGDPGTTVVTSRRLLFFGPGYTREWSYDGLTGLMDDARVPMTLLRVGGEASSGVAVPPAAAKGFRFQLRLAIADAYGDRAGLVAEIDRLIGWHQQQRPVPPVPADPASAPRSAWWSPLRASLIGGAALLFVLCVVGAVLAPPPATHDVAGTDPTVTTVVAPTPTTASPALAVGAPPLATAASSPAGDASSVAGPGGAPITGPAVRKTTKPATTKPKPKPKPTTKKPVDLCGAPSNPLGYNFCGGSHITSPDADTCLYFDCIASFDDGKGYMEQCSDGTVSMSGGRSGSCSSHGGNRRPVYQS